MPGWADDPELLATFRAEVEERVASLQAGLLVLETHPSPRQVVTGLFRDAHTVKGSARMLGLTGVLQVAHRCEDVLGALRDGRFGSGMYSGSSAARGLRGVTRLDSSIASGVPASVMSTRGLQSAG